MSSVADNPNGSIDTNTAQPVPSEDTQVHVESQGSSITTISLGDTPPTPLTPQTPPSTRAQPLPSTVHVWSQGSGITTSSIGDTPPATPRPPPPPPPPLLPSTVHAGSQVSGITTISMGDTPPPPPPQPQPSTVHVGSFAEARVPGRTQLRTIAASVEDVPREQTGPIARAVQGGGQETRAKVVLLCKRIEGEIGTSLVILKSHNEKEIRLFKDNVILLSQSMTQMHPSVFAGPRDELCKCSGRNGMMIFQYAQMFKGSSPVSDWNASDPPHSVEAFLMQVFLTLKLALDAKVLPANITKWKDVLIGNGAVMIDIVPYLSRHLYEPQCSLFGERCESLFGLCAGLVAKHARGSILHRRILALEPGARAAHVLCTAIECLRDAVPSERTTPLLLTLHGNFVTFKDYASDVPSWLTHLGEEEDACERSLGRLLVYGEPKPFRGDQTAECTRGTKLHELVRNIVLRIRVRLLGFPRVDVTALDCTRGLIRVALNKAALSSVPSLDELDRSTLVNVSGKRFTHDCVSQKESAWAPVVMIARIKTPGPTPALAVDYFRVTVLMVLLGSEGTVGSLTELFQHTAMFSAAD